MNARMTIPQPIHCRSFGHGPRKVLALHCTIAHAGAWRGLAGLMEEAEFHCPDMLCHGRSPDWDGQGDFHDRMTKAVLQHLTERMDVVGHSFGATLALRLAVEQPDLVRSLTLIESIHFGVVREQEPQMMDEQQKSSAPFRAAVETGDYELAARLFNRGWGDRDGARWDEMPESTRAAMTRGVRIVPACSPAVFDDRPGLLRPGVLERVRMPVLLLRGARTAPAVAAVNDAFARRFLDAENVVVPGAGHMLPVTHPRETADHLRRFLARGVV